MPKKALIILAEGFEEIEAAACIDILRRAAIEVTVAGLNSIMVKGCRGLVITADKELDKAGFDFDACVLPGGGLGARNLAQSSKVNSLLNKMNKEQKIIAAICASPAVVLAPLGILDNKSATCFKGMQDSFNSSTVYKEDGVVIDKNIITSQGPATAVKFALKITEVLMGEEVRDKVKEDILDYT